MLDWETIIKGIVIGDGLLFTGFIIWILVIWTIKYMGNNKTQEKKWKK